MQLFKFVNWSIGEFVVSFFDVTNRLLVIKMLTSSLSFVGSEIGKEGTDFFLLFLVF